MNLEQILAPLKKLTSTLSPRQVAGLAVVFVAVVGIVVGSAYWITSSTYALLAADLDAESAQSIVTKLKNDKVPYELGDGGRSIRVPSERVDELRLQLATDGLPSAGRIGFELFDKPAFGTTDLLEHVNYQRALEGELARTISTLTEVASARVHIVMPKDSLFADQAEEAKASVVLRLKGNKPIGAATARGIANLVAASVESLRPDSVVILDTYGRQLSRPSDDAADQPGGLQLDRQQQLEHDMSSKVVALLEPVVGDGRVRVNVSARLNADAEETTEERWDPTTVMRSHQTTTESDLHTVTQGVAGARANLPPAPSDPNAATGANNAANGAAANNNANGAASAAAPTVPPVVAVPTGSNKNSEITNYEVSKLTTHRVSPRGQLARLSVAVILDDEHVTTKLPSGQVQVTTKPRSAAEIQRIQSLVAAAVGLDTTRGDQLTVENVAFDAVPDDSVPAPTAWWQPIRDTVRDNGLTLFRTLAIALLAVVAFFGVLRPMMRRATEIASPQVLPAPAPMGDRPPTVQELEGQMAAAGADARRLPSLSRQVARLANDEPEQLARIVRGWLAEEER